MRKVEAELQALNSSTKGARGLVQTTIDAAAHRKEAELQGSSSKLSAGQFGGPIQDSGSAGHATTKLVTIRGDAVDDAEEESTEDPAMVYHGRSLSSRYCDFCLRLTLRRA